MIRLLFVATSYPADLTDWRGLFIRHLADALGRRADLRVEIWAPPGERGSMVANAATDAESRWLGELMRSGGIAHALRSNPMRGGWLGVRLLFHLRTLYRRERNGAQIFHCNWLQTMLPAPRGVPVLVTVLGTDMQLLKLPAMPALLRWSMRRRSVAICPNAQWMEAPLRKLFGVEAHVHTVPFGIDARWYAVERRFEAEPVPRWLVVSRLTRGKLGHLIAWGEGLFADGKRELHLFGPMQETIDLPPWIQHHGPIGPAALREQWFPRAQGLITLSQHSEGRPQVMLEAMAAGLPIIASLLPAHADLLQHDGTGLLCDSPQAFERSLRQLEDPAINRRIGSAARTWVRAAVGTWDDCAARYAALYRRLLAEAQT